MSMLGPQQHIEVYEPDTRNTGKYAVTITYNNWAILPESDIVTALNFVKAYEYAVAMASYPDDIRAINVVKVY